MMSPLQTDDDRVTIAALGLDAELHTNTQQTAPGGAWFAQSVSLGGFFSKPIALYPSVFGLALGVDQDGQLWQRSVLGRGGPDALRGTWTKEYDSPRIPAGDPPIRLIPSSSDSSRFDLYYYDRNTTSFGYATHDSTSGWRPNLINLPPGNFINRRPTTYSDTLGKVWTFATGTNGNVYINLSGWTTIPGVQAAGPPAVTMAPDSKFKIVVRGTDGQLWYTSETACGARTFDPWQPIPGSGNTGTDPTVSRFDGTWVVAYRTDFDLPILRRYIPPPPALAAASADSFVDVPLTPPA